MAELLLSNEQDTLAPDIAKVGHVTVLEAFASLDQPISLDAEGRCTPTGWNVDYDD